MKHAKRAGLVVLLAAAAGVASAQDRPRQAETVSVSLKARLGAGAGYEAPLGASVGGELLYGLGARVREDGERVDALAGVLLQAQAGRGGGKLSLGGGARARIHADDFKGTLGAGLKLSLARTWGEHPGTGAQRTYLGPELDLSAMHVGLSLGTLWRVGGPAGHRVVLSWGIGVRI